MNSINSKLRVAVICGYPFPDGLAATNRIISYSKGLIANDVKVEVFLYNPTETVNKTLSKSGVFQGIYYYYPLKRVRHSIKLFHFFEIIFGHFFTFFRIIIEHFKQSYTALIISNDNIFTLLLFGFLSKFINTKSIFIFDEYPIPIRAKLKEKIPLAKSLSYKIVLRSIDAYVSISSKLSSYYNSLYSRNTLILPVVVDISRFKQFNRLFFDTREISYVCYMGNMELSKDNIDVIIKAFYLIINDFPNLELHLYGIPDPKNLKILQDLVSSLNLINKVKFKGTISYDEVPEILNKAKVLVSSQPSTLRASGGFPTKLGEYLAAGVPTLMTDVGENGKYVKDEEHLFLTKPNDPTMFAEKLKYILNNYDNSLKIAYNGRQYIIQNYSHNIMGKRLKDFLITLK